jgi:hypothetical protein
VGHNTLAVQRIRARKAELQRRVDAGEISPEQGRAQYLAFVREMMERRGERRVIKPST